MFDATIAAVFRRCWELTMICASKAMGRILPAVVVVTFVAIAVPSNAGATTLAFGAPQVFQESGSVVTTYQTPSNTCDLLVDALGGSGGSGYDGYDSVGPNTDYGASGGVGGSLSSLVAVSGAQALSVSVGANGVNGTSDVAGVGGYGGGGAGGLSGDGDTAGGGGGGESTVAIQGGSSLAVAGGGGGGNDDWGTSSFEVTGGAGGQGANTSGSNGGNLGDTSPGEGGTLSSGGAGTVGYSGYNGGAGSANHGGNGAGGAAGEVGGGGASGYFGGGGGGMISGSGGGSTYAAAGSQASNTTTWSPNPTSTGNGEVVLTAEQCQSTTFGAPPVSPNLAGSYTPSASSTSALGDTFTVDSSTSANCSISGSVVTFSALSTCTVDANQGGNASWAPAPQAQQTFTITRATPTAPTISNLPSNAAPGQSFVPTVSTTGDGTTSVTSNSSGVCTVTGGIVSFLSKGTCSLTAHVGVGTDYLAADGGAETFFVNGPAPRLVIVSFDSDGGSPVTGATGSQGESITLPTAPEFAGNTFDGWFIAPIGGTALSSPYLLTLTTTLYAQWTPAVTSLAVTTVPTSPTITATSRSARSITVTLTKAAGSGGSAITAYQCDINGSWRTVVFNRYHQMTIVHLSARRTDVVVVRALNAVGRGQLSNRVRVRV
jgi:hypothetical protein